MKAPILFSTILLLTSFAIAQQEEDYGQREAELSFAFNPREQNAEEDFFAYPIVIDLLKAENATLKEVIETLQTKIIERIDDPEQAPNFIFMGNNGQIPIPSLTLRNVSPKSVLKIIQSIAQIQLEVVVDKTGTNSIIIRQEQQLSDPFAVNVGPTGDDTDGYVWMFPIDDIGVDPESFEQQVRLLWDLKYPDWRNESPAPRLLYHEGTEIFLVKASRDLGNIVQDLLATIRDRQEEKGKDLLLLHKQQIKILELQLAQKKEAEIENEVERQALMDKINALEFLNQKKKQE